MGLSIRYVLWTSRSDLEAVAGQVVTGIAVTMGAPAVHVCSIVS